MAKTHSRTPTDVKLEEVLLEAPKHVSLLSLTACLGLSRSSASQHWHKMGWMPQIRLAMRHPWTDEAVAQDASGVSGGSERAPGPRMPSEERLVEPDYRYDEDGDYYVFALNGRTKVFPGEVWRRACEMYSEMGENKTLALVAEEINVPRPDLEVCFKKYQFFKSSQPFSHEEFMGLDEEEADERTLEVKRRRWRSRMQRKERADLLKRLEESEIREGNRKLLLNSLSAEFRELVGELAPPPSKPILPKQADGAEPYVLHAPVADLHAGKMVWGEEGFGSNYDTNAAAGRLVKHAEMIAEYVERQQGRCKRIYLTDLGDMFHALNGQTENGTDLHQDTRPMKVWRKVSEAKIRCIELLRGYAEEIVVMGAPGNHDGVFHSLFFHGIALRYLETPDVRVDDRVGRYNHFIEGRTIHLLDHGKHLGKLNSDKTRASLEREVRAVVGEDYYSARHTVCYFGHLHEHEEAPQGGHMQMIRLPAFSETDDYETDRRYFSDPVAQLFRLDGEGRRKSQEFLYL